MVWWNRLGTRQNPVKAEIPRARSQDIASDRQISSIRRRKAIGDWTPSAVSKQGQPATLTVPYQFHPHTFRLGASVV
jgi:hypothetical protein